MAEPVYEGLQAPTQDTYGRIGRQQEREERREERTAHVNANADDLNSDPGRPTQQDAVQLNTAQQQHGGKVNATLIH